MSVYKWTKNMSVGENRLDRQHQQLLLQINKIIDAIVLKKTSKEIFETIDFFIELCKEHFFYEEVYMKKRRYPKLQEHKKIHQAFIKNGIVLKEKLKNGDEPKELVIDIEKYFGEWWVKHINEEDKKYCSFAVRLVKEFIPLKDKYETFAGLIGEIIGFLATKNGYRYQLISSRAKDPQRLKQKILTKRYKEYEKLSDINDLAGVRIVFYLEGDRKKFLEKLYEEFGNSKDSIIEVSEQKKPNGYHATHIVLRLDKKRIDLPEYSDFKEMKCEVQITSSLYHAWSEIEHGIIYKPDGNKDNLMKLGLKELEVKFRELYKHIENVSNGLDFISENYKKIKDLEKSSLSAGRQTLHSSLRLRQGTVSSEEIKI